MFKIFLIFFKIGASTFGGGYAMLPIIERELVDKYKLINKDEFIDFVSISQSFPGPIAVNIALLIGYKISKIKGSIFSLLGVVLPSFLSILILGFLYVNFSYIDYVEKFFDGVNAVIPALLLVSFLSVFKKINKNTTFYFLSIISFILIFKFNINPVWTIVLGGFIGICMSFLKHT